MTGGRGPPITGGPATVGSHMDLTFREEAVEGAPVLELRGQADLSTLPILHERVNRFASDHRGQHTIIDLDGLDAFEPVTVGVFVGARLALRAGGGDLDLVGSAPELVALFRSSALDATFPLFTTVGAAVAGR
jgi:anti-anti-sigma factor